MRAGGVGWGYRARVQFQGPLSDAEKVVFQQGLDGVRRPSFWDHCSKLHRPPNLQLCLERLGPQLSAAWPVWQIKRSD